MSIGPLLGSDERALCESVEWGSGRDRPPSGNSRRPPICESAYRSCGQSLGNPRVEGVGPVPPP
ncbi:hypothetical protein Mx4_p82 [Myxococcus phage Mx4]|nr:hypothetical protein Mx4_p82 [Myxococcus phage Mx4]